MAFYLFLLSVPRTFGDIEEIPYFQVTGIICYFVIWKNLNSFIKSGRGVDESGE